MPLLVFIGFARLKLAGRPNHEVRLMGGGMNQYKRGETKKENAALVKGLW